MSGLEDELKAVAPSLQSVVKTAEQTVIRRAIWSLPKPVLWVAVVLVILLSAFFGK